MLGSPGPVQVRENVIKGLLSLLHALPPSTRGICPQVFNVTNEPLEGRKVKDEGHNVNETAERLHIQGENDWTHVNI